MVEIPRENFHKGKYFSWAEGSEVQAVFYKDMPMWFAEHDISFCSFYVDKDEDSNRFKICCTYKKGELEEKLEYGDFIDMDDVARWLENPDDYELPEM